MLTDFDATQLDPDHPDASRSSFTQEVSVMSALQGHPAIVQLVGFTESPICSIVMRLY